jgi:anti-sigma B factor antagonist
METQVQEYDGVTIVRIAGEVDGSTAPVLQDEVLAYAQPGCRLLLDMSLVEFMSSAGLRVMLLLHRQISGGNGQLMLVGLSQALQDTMAATGFLKYFATSDDIDTGLEALRQ